MPHDTSQVDKLNDTQVSTRKGQHPKDPSPASKLPHERDATPENEGAVEQPEVEQAYRDVRKGLVDTDARNTDGRPEGSHKPAGR